MLVLLVGPSGAGKDVLLEAARDRLVGNPAFRFVTTTTTRACKSGERYRVVNEAEFARMRAAGFFVLTWRSRGAEYGLPIDIVGDLAHGRLVVAAATRAVAAEAAARFPVHVIEVTAPPDVLARRLAARGQEDAVAAAGRMSRAGSLNLPPGRDIIVNDTSVEQGLRKLLAVLARLSARKPLPG
jgi:ribose 1,5-bisphosphokinase